MMRNATVAIASVELPNLLISNTTETFSLFSWEFTEGPISFAGRPMQWFVTIRLFEMVVIHWSRLQIYGIGIVGLLIFVFLSVYFSSREDHNCFCTLEEELQKSRVQISKLQEELQKSKVQISELQHQVHSRETRYRVVAREYTELCSEEGSLKAQIKDLQQKLDAKCVMNKIMWNAGGEYQKKFRSMEADRDHVLKLAVQYETLVSTLLVRLGYTHCGATTQSEDACLAQAGLDQCGLGGLDRDDDDSDSAVSKQSDASELDDDDYANDAEESLDDNDEADDDSDDSTVSDTSISNHGVGTNCHATTEWAKCDKQRQRCLGAGKAGISCRRSPQSSSIQECLTFYVGNVSFQATQYHLKKAFQRSLNIKVDTAVIARSANGLSRGCAFVTVKWRDFFQFDPEYSTQTGQLWANRLCTIMSGESVLGRKIYVELAKQQRRQ